MIMLNNVDYNHCTNSTHSLSRGLQYVNCSATIAIYTVYMHVYNSYMHT